MAFIILGIFGIICSMVAHGKGRSPIGWFFIGFIAPLLGIILVCVLPDLKEAERRFNRLGKQNRLLRERLRQSRLATRSRLAGVNRRLSAHDRSLDMDTSNDAQPEGLPYEDDEYADRDDDVVPVRSPAVTRATPAAQRGTARVERPVARPATARYRSAEPEAPGTTRTVQSPVRNPPLQANPPRPRPNR